MLPSPDFSLTHRQPLCIGTNYLWGAVCWSDVLCGTILQGATTTVNNSCQWLSHEMSQVWLSSCFPRRIHHRLWVDWHVPQSAAGECVHWLIREQSLRSPLPTHNVSPFISPGNSHQIQSIQHYQESTITTINRALIQGCDVIIRPHMYQWT